jgi:tRNA nucleotidyltransferase (CCA-adding enzyme)
MHIILTHEQADFDAAAAMLGASLMNDQALPVLPRRMNRNVRQFLSLYAPELPFMEVHDLPVEPIESVTLVDTQSLVTLKGMTKRTTVEVVDHHQVKEGLPEGWRLTTDRVGSCTTLFVEMLQEHNGELNLIHATLLLLGIYEDTGSLTYASTTPRDVRAAAYLMEQGANLRLAAEYLNPPLSPEQRQVYERLLEAAKTYDIHGQTIVVACTQAEEMTEEISSVAHKMRDLLDPDALFLLISTTEGIRLVARSTTDRVDVSAVAVQFGGGGHERAAAALIHKKNDLTMEGVCQKLTAILQEVVQPPLMAGKIMSADPLVLSPTMTAQDVAKLMQRYGFEGYPVAENGKLIGLLTRRAVDRALTHKLNLPVASLMEAGEVSVSPQDAVEHLQHLMAESGWGQVPVIDPESGKIVGIVTRTDLLKTLAGAQEKKPERQNLAEKLESVLPPTRLALLKTIAGIACQQRMPVYIVGGFVRDLVLDKPGLDFDIVVEGDAIALGKALANRFGGRVVAHARFVTAKWWIADIQEKLALELGSGLQAKDLPPSLDLISARREFYDYPTALPTVERSSIKHDLHRRDFTFNTLALRLDGRHYGDLYDHYGGLPDLQRGLVRVLHSLSFVDDPTRILRAVRFEQRFGFKIEERTLQLMQEARSMLRQVSGERLRHEFDLILAENQGVTMLARLNELDLLTAIHPDLPWSNGIEKQLTVVLNSKPDPEWKLPAQWGHIPMRQALSYLVWLGRLPSVRAGRIATSLRFNRVLREGLLGVCRLWLEIPALVGKTPSQAVGALESVSPVVLYALTCMDLTPEAQELIRSYITRWQKLEPVTTGQKLRSLKVPPGPEYSRILNTLRAAWLDGRVKSEEEEERLLNRLLGR